MAHAARARRGQDRRQGSHASVPDWAGELQEQQRQFDANPQSAARLTEVEQRAIEVAMRLLTYQAYSGDRLQTTGLILIMPRPTNAKYLADTAKTIKEAREKARPERPAALQARRAQGDLHLLERHPAR